ncbi:hypothetical protein CEXT_719901 [Caerostris extrusa]|uniref:Uncharacterized protein n=1 Tax=Caerostris extrusa TaxID=172846 RepID=A0AAV4X9V7_CAEEX|nr:hypothetical protein CEXT_719901 [Caerostris extrusa]
MCYKPGYPMPSLISTFGKYSGLLIRIPILVQFPHFSKEFPHLENKMCINQAGYFVPRFPHLENKMCYKPGYPMPSLISTFGKYSGLLIRIPYPSSISPFSNTMCYPSGYFVLGFHIWKTRCAINQATYA